MNECPQCNHHNPGQASTCRVCNLSLPRSNPSSIMHSTVRPKMAVFDLDKTLFDLSRRERAARRQGLKEGSDKWYEFLNQNKYILMDTPIPGTVSFVKALSSDDYTIAYLSGRPSSSLAATKQSLQESGFPIDALERDLVFLHSGKGSIKNITNHKKTILTHLKNRFDIHFFFDDTPEFREAAKSLFIPGVYSSVAAYTGKEERASAPKKTKSKRPRKNPHALVCPDHGIRAENEVAQDENGSLICTECGAFLKMDGNVKLNPPPMPRKKRNKAGNMVKEPIKKYMSRFMADPKMNEEFPDNAQRFAVGLSYARKFYGDAKVDKAYPPRSNPQGGSLSLSSLPMMSLAERKIISRIVKSVPKDKQRELMAKDIPGDAGSELTEDIFSPAVTNPPRVTGAGATRPVNLSDMNKHKIRSIDFMDEQFQPYALPINLIKRLKSYLHGSREYIGFFEVKPGKEDDVLYTGTGFGIGSVGLGADSFQHCMKNQVPITFHTHPSRKNNFPGFGAFDWQNPSWADHRATFYESLVFPHHKMELVVTKFGIHILRPYINPRSKLGQLTKKLAGKKGTKAQQKELAALVSKDLRIMSRGGTKWRVKQRQLLELPRHQNFDIETVGDAGAEAFNSLTTSFRMKHDYFAWPIAGVDWTSKDEKGLKGKFDAVRANPGNVSEAKEMYKQFHQKTPKNVEKKKVDFGDTWVGLGKAWSIGYRSGKETGNEAQKYIHNFGVDEESGKKFKEPELYYVKNNDGSQMMVIMGGDWYIDVDDEGKMSWIYV